MTRESEIIKTAFGLNNKGVTEILKEAGLPPSTPIVFWDGKGRSPLDQSETVDSYALRNRDGSVDYDLGA